MKIARNDKPSKEKPAKRIPMHKDVEFKARLKLEFITAHNKRIQRKEEKACQNDHLELRRKLV